MGIGEFDLRVDNLEPGRALDMDIARIVGWKWDRHQAVGPQGQVYAIRGKVEEEEWLRFYSTDDGDALSAASAVLPNPWTLRRQMGGYAVTLPSAYMSGRLTPFTGTTAALTLCAAIVWWYATAPKEIGWLDSLVRSNSKEPEPSYEILIGSAAALRRDVQQSIREGWRMQSGPVLVSAPTGDQPAIFAQAIVLGNVEGR